jgi:uncharacterized protein (TIGR02271 family)
VNTGRGAGGLPGEDVYDLAGKEVYDLDGHKVGTAATLYVAGSSGTAAPEWVTVKTGLFGNRESFVPLAGSRADEAGLHVNTRKDVIKDAPRGGGDEGLPEHEVIGLYRHYGLLAGASGQPGGRTADAAAGAQQPVVRSEERLRAGTETAEAGRVRLRKYVVTGEQQVTVPVRHEEVHLTREPVTAEEARAAGGTAGIGEEEREAVLHEERPVVAKETVPVEKVSLGTETVQEEHQVSGTVRREEVEVDDDAARRR